jgi:selenide,water dikinase
VLTVDFFTPIVDDPRTYGRIAAANSLSDVYAMGGTPFAALNIVGYPASSPDLPLEFLGEILEGGVEKAAEANVAIIGGHTVDDREPKYGLAVFGRVHPRKVVLKNAVRRGDSLILTKPLGTGILTTALKKDKRAASDLAEAVRVMETLNRGAAEAMLEGEVHAATDITGFGLLGHLLEMLRDSGLGARLSASTFPVLEGARELAEEGIVPGGTCRNLASAASGTRIHERVSEADRLIAADAQTSGGLLIAVPSTERDVLVRRLKKRGTPAAAIIGEIVDSPGIELEP